MTLRPFVLCAAVAVALGGCAEQSTSDVAAPDAAATAPAPAATAPADVATPAAAPAETQAFYGDDAPVAIEPAPAADDHGHSHDAEGEHEHAADGSHPHADEHAEEEAHEHDEGSAPHEH